MRANYQRPEESSQASCLKLSLSFLLTRIKVYCPFCPTMPLVASSLHLEPVSLLQNEREGPGDRYKILYNSNILLYIHKENTEKWPYPRSVACNPRALAFGEKPEVAEKCHWWRCACTLFSQWPVTLEMSQFGRKYGGISENKHRGGSVWGILFFVQGLRSVSKRHPKSSRGGPLSGKLLLIRRLWENCVWRAKKLGRE